MSHHKKITDFAQKVEKEQTKEVKILYPSLNADAVKRHSKVTLKPGKKYTKIDVGTSGKFMIDKNGGIFGIKGYGVINKKKQYGTLDTINEWNWGGYLPEKIPF